MPIHQGVFRVLEKSNSGYEFARVIENPWIGVLGDSRTSFYSYEIIAELTEEEQLHWRLQCLEEALKCCSTSV